MKDIADEKILVLDFGSQYSQMIVKRIRQCSVFSLLTDHSISAERLRQLAPSGIVLSGGPASVYDQNAPKPDPKIFGLGVPILGICYGMQTLSEHFGGKVRPVTRREFGRAIVSLGADGSDDPLFAGVEPTTDVWMSHGDQVSDAGGNFIPLASTETCPLAAVKHRNLPFYGLQFHPEVAHTAEGQKIIQNFVRTICQTKGNWTMENFVETSIAKLRAQIGTENVICGLSGGVDSAVVAALVAKAVGKQLTCIFVNTGLMRKGEIDTVAEVFTKNFDTRLIVVDAERRFLDALAGVTDPQQKRKIIGKLFIDVFTDEAGKIDGAKFLAQGTIYPDIVESGGTADNPSATIKFHHNVGGLPADLEFQLVEPLRELYKEDVRAVGRELGLPEEIVARHPFPGPGLGVRCLGELTKEKLDTLREADAIVIDEIKKAGLYNKTSQVFAVLLPVRSVGVMGDGRTYENAIAIRCVSTNDFMTADWTRLPYDLLAVMSTRIINEVKGVNRVVYDISSKPPATIEWE